MQKQQWIIGIDEVGRGPLAGPLTVAAVAAMINHKSQTTRFAKVSARRAHNKQFPKLKILKNIKDSKKLSPIKREEWNEKIRGKFMYAIASVGPATIDRIGISRAARLAVSRCLKKLAAFSLPSATHAFVILDGGLYAPRMYANQETIIKGDERHPFIAAASIVAKVHRDACMRRLHKKFSLYGFNRHKGYGTAFHREALKTHGLSSVHRRSFCDNIKIW